MKLTTARRERPDDDRLEDSDLANRIPQLCELILVEDLVGCVPGIDAVAHVKGMQICNVNSDDITGAHWIVLARTIDELAARTVPVLG